MKNRKRNRMVGFDYSSDNLYFVTICVQDRLCCFGSVISVGTGRDLSVHNPNAIHPNAIHPNAIHPNAIHPNAINPNAIHPNAIHPNAIHPNAIHPNAIHPNAIHPNEIHPNEIHPNAIHPNEIHPNEIHPNDINPNKINHNQIHLNEIHPNEIHPNEINHNKINHNQIHPNAIHPNAIHPNAIHPNEIHLNEINQNTSTKKIELNAFGKIAHDRIIWLSKQYDYVVIHNFVVMPNHVHAIIEIDSKKLVHKTCDLSNEKNEAIKIKSISSLLGAFKTTSSKLIHQSGFLTFSWQRSFYDHIIRNNSSYDRISNYIDRNPEKWISDTFFKKH